MWLKLHIRTPTADAKATYSFTRLEIRRNQIPIERSHSPLRTQAKKT